MLHHSISMPVVNSNRRRISLTYLVWLRIATGWDFGIALHDGVNEHIYLTIFSYHVTYAFQSKSTLYSCLNVKENLAQNKCDICSLSDCNGTRTHNHLVRKQTTVYPKWPNDGAVLWILLCTVHLTVCPYHETSAFQSESTLYSKYLWKHLRKHQWKTFMYLLTGFWATTMGR